MDTFDTFDQYGGQNRHINVYGGACFYWQIWILEQVKKCTAAHNKCTLIEWLSYWIGTTREASKKVLFLVARTQLP